MARKSTPPPGHYELTRRDFWSIGAVHIAALVAFELNGRFFLLRSLLGLLIKVHTEVGGTDKMVSIVIAIVAVIIAFFAARASNRSADASVARTALTKQERTSVERREIQALRRLIQDVFESHRIAPRKPARKEWDDLALEFIEMTLKMDWDASGILPAKSDRDREGIHYGLGYLKRLRQDIQDARRDGRNYGQTHRQPYHIVDALLAPGLLLWDALRVANGIAPEKFIDPRKTTLGWSPWDQKMDELKTQRMINGEFNKAPQQPPPTESADGSTPDSDPKS